MDLIYRRSIIRNAPARWMRQYEKEPDDKKVGWHGAKTFGEVRTALKTLDLDTCSPADVDKAMGIGTRWADNRCTNCDEDASVLVHLGDSAGYEARYQQLCQHCLMAAAALLRAAPAKP